MDERLRRTLNGTNLLLSFVVGHLVTGYLVSSSGQTAPEGLDVIFTLIFTALAFGIVYALQQFPKQ